MTRIGPEIRRIRAGLVSSSTPRNARSRLGGVAHEREGEGASHFGGLGGLRSGRCRLLDCGQPPCLETRLAQRIRRARDCRYGCHRADSRGSTPHWSLESVPSTTSFITPSRAPEHIGQVETVRFRVGYTYTDANGTEFLDQYRDYASGLWCRSLPAICPASPWTPLPPMAARPSMSVGPSLLRRLLPDPQPEFDCRRVCDLVVCHRVDSQPPACTYFAPEARN